MNNKKRDQIKEAISKEYLEKVDILKSRKDYSPSLDYFIDVLSELASPDKLKQRVNKPIAISYCATVPSELLDCFGYQPVHLYCGSMFINERMSELLPTLCCPAIKSCVNSLCLDFSLENLSAVRVLPATCDWKVKLKDMVPEKDFLFLEMPKARDEEKNITTWLEQIIKLKCYLEKQTKTKLNKTKLINSIDKYMLAWSEFMKLIDLRRQGRVPGVWSLALTNSFMLDDVSVWTKKLKELLASDFFNSVSDKPKVFLAGSPVFFPNFKIVELIESAGMIVAGDSLCTSEMLFNSVVYNGKSEYDLLKALTDKYYLSCNCPVFSLDERKTANIIDTMKKHGFSGMIFHVFKGCHPYDIESLYFEKLMRENDLRFIRLETDPSRHDKENLLVRLEAFSNSLQNKGEL